MRVELPNSSQIELTRNALAGRVGLGGFLDVIDVLLQCRAALHPLSLRRVPQLRRSLDINLRGSDSEVAMPALKGTAWQWQGSAHACAVRVHGRHGSDWQWQRQLGTGSG